MSKGILFHLNSLQHTNLTFFFGTCSTDGFPNHLLNERQTEILCRADSRLNPPLSAVAARSKGQVSSLDCLRLQGPLA